MLETEMALLSQVSSANTDWASIKKQLKEERTSLLQIEKEIGIP
jgi:hypothetical protein